MGGRGNGDTVGTEAAYPPVGGPPFTLARLGLHSHADVGAGWIPPPIGLRGRILQHLDATSEIDCMIA
jgi:hypothetical protein